MNIWKLIMDNNPADANARNLNRLWHLFQFNFITLFMTK